MRLSEICVQRPVFAFMLIMFLVVMGVFSFRQLGVDLFPSSDPATVLRARAAARCQPRKKSFQVVMPLEEAIASVSGIDELRAIVTEGTRTSSSPSCWSATSAKRPRTFAKRSAARCASLPPNVLPPTVQKGGSRFRPRHHACPSAASAASAS